MPETVSERDITRAEWQVTQIDSIDGGLNASKPAHLIEDNEWKQANNIVVRDGVARTDTGYGQLGVDPFTSEHQLLLGNPRKVIEHVNVSGGRTPVCITDKTFYRFVGTAWEATKDSVAGDTLNVALTGGETTITLVSRTGFPTSGIAIFDNDGGDQVAREYTHGAGAQDLDFTVALPSPFIASTGNVVETAVKLAGTNENEVVAVLVPSEPWTAFTNGVDVPKRFDGTDVIDIPGLSAITLTAARTMSWYKNVLNLGNVVEGGTARVNRVRWPDVGDPSTWNAGTAGFEDLFNTSDPIVGMAPLGNDNIIYRGRGISKQEHLGTDTKLWNFRTMIYGFVSGASGVGAVSANSVFPAGDRHIVMHRDGIYSYQGGFSIQDISKKVFDGVFDANGEFDKSLGHRAFIQYVDEHDEVFCFYPVKGDEYCKRALVLNLKNGAWGKRTFSEQFTGAGLRVKSGAVLIQDLVGAIFEQEWTMLSGPITGSDTPSVALCGNDLKVYQYDYITPSEDGVSIAWEVVTREFYFPDRDLRFDRFDFMLQGNAIQVHYSFDGGQSWVILGTFGPAPSLTRFKVYLQFLVERICFRFKGTGGGVRISTISLKHRNESRWDL